MLSLLLGGHRLLDEVQLCLTGQPTLPVLCNTLSEGPYSGLAGDLLRLLPQDLLFVHIQAV